MSSKTIPMLKGAQQLQAAGQFQSSDPAFNPNGERSEKTGLLVDSKDNVANVYIEPAIGTRFQRR